MGTDNTTTRRKLTGEGNCWLAMVLGVLAFGVGCALQEDAGEVDGKQAAPTAPVAPPCNELIPGMKRNDPLCILKNPNNLKPEANNVRTGNDTPEGRELQKLVDETTFATARNRPPGQLTNMDQPMVQLTNEASLCSGAESRIGAAITLTGRSIEASSVPVSQYIQASQALNSQHQARLKEIRKLQEAKDEPELSISFGDSPNVACMACAIKNGPIDIRYYALSTDAGLAAMGASMTCSQMLEKLRYRIAAADCQKARKIGAISETFKVKCPNNNKATQFGNCIALEYYKHLNDPKSLNASWATNRQAILGAYRNACAPTCRAIPFHDTKDYQACISNLGMQAKLSDPALDQDGAFSFPTYKTACNADPTVYSDCGITKP